MSSTKECAYRTIGALAMAANTKGTQHILDIKDGHTDMDKASVIFFILHPYSFILFFNNFALFHKIMTITLPTQLYMHPSFSQLFYQIEQ